MLLLIEIFPCPSLSLSQKRNRYYISRHPRMNENEVFFNLQCLTFFSFNGFNSYCCFTRCIGGKTWCTLVCCKSHTPRPRFSRFSPGAASPQSEWEQRSLAALQLCDKPGPEREREERWLEATGKGTGSECTYYGYTLILSSANSIEWPKVLDSRHKWHHWRLAPGAPNKASQYGSTKFPYL